MKTVLKYFFIFILWTVHAQNAEKMKVTIFYESHCDHSKVFIKKIFYPVYKNLQNHIAVDLVPYGRTKQFLQDGKKIFECPNVDHNCKANKIHACAVGSRAPDEIIVEFVNCILDSQYGEEDIASCSFASGLQHTMIEQCLERQVSEHLLSDFGNKTLSYDLEQIPAVVFDEKYDKGLDRRARENFMGAICEYLNYEDVSACESYGLWS